MAVAIGVPVVNFLVVLSTGTEHDKVDKGSLLCSGDHKLVATTTEDKLLSAALTVSVALLEAQDKDGPINCILIGNPTTIAPLQAALPVTRAMSVCVMEISDRYIVEITIAYLACPVFMPTRFVPSSDAEPMDGVIAPATAEELASAPAPTLTPTAAAADPARATAAAATATTSAPSQSTEQVQRRRLVQRVLNSVLDGRGTEDIDLTEVLTILIQGVDCSHARD